jgi:hypothetical protein
LSDKWHKRKKSFNYAIYLSVPKKKFAHDNPPEPTRTHCVPVDKIKD